MQGSIRRRSPASLNPRMYSTAAPGMRRNCIDIAHGDVWLDFVFVQPGARRRMVDWVQQSEKFARAIAVAQHRKRNHRPQSRVSVLAAVLAHAGHIAFDVTRIEFALIE